jgi:hypothetical protein
MSSNVSFSGRPLAFLNIEEHLGSEMPALLGWMESDGKKRPSGPLRKISLRSINLPDLEGQCIPGPGPKLLNICYPPNQTITLHASIVAAHIHKARLRVGMLCRFAVPASNISTARVMAGIASQIFWAM